jgi:pyruvate kinase
MLSDETAAGQYPMEAVSIMKRVIRYTESNAPLRAVFTDQPTVPPTRQLAISRGIISLATSIRAAAIVAETKSGATALQIAAERPQIPIVAVTDDARTAQQLAIVYDVRSYVRPASKNAASKLTDVLRETNVLKKGDIVVTASGQYPGVVGTTDTIKVRQLD